ncbi:MAG: Transcription initiation factor TFIID subunit 12 [Piccolia ochrophora]|nr:MAG: Transcription initiation factor TFIID subunit 12 [Piccolia ochrophora]
MNNNNAARSHQGVQQQHGPQSQGTLIRVDMVRSLPHLNDHQKDTYENGIKSLWDAIQNSSPDTPEHVNAKNKLIQVSNNIRETLKKYHLQQSQAQQAAHAGQPGAARPQAQGPAGPQAQAAASRPPGQGPAGQQAQPGAPQQPQPQSQQQPPLPPAILGHVQSFPFTLPPNIAQGSPESEKWLAEAKQRYGQALQRAEAAKQRLQALQAQVQQRQASGKPLSPQETQEIQTKKATLTRAHAESKKYIDSFRQQQADYKTQAQSQQGKSGGAEAPAQASQNGNAANVTSRGPQKSPVAAPSSAQVPSSAQTQAPKPQVTNPAVEAARNQANSVNRGSMSPSAAGQPPAPSAVQVQTSQPQSAVSGTPVPSQFPQQAPNALAGPGAGAQHFPRDPQHSQQQNNSPQTAQPQSATQAGPVRPLTHQAALSQAARAYSNGIPTSTPTSATYQNHPHPPPTTRDINTQKMPIPKQLNLQTPKPVAMGPARPSFSGGSSQGANGMMGQPAYQQMPSYTLEGDGERVLSKKKLDELVRQVTGGGEGLGGEGLTPEVEESVLQIADEFVDQVIENACQLAKLRNSSTLEIRDIQLILERNYNIRIPGYASDEVRTVKKFAPTAGWSQKLAAVQASKVKMPE